jgi:glutathione synthase/RimK-type ligase-like ATP-grasp enzyme
MSLKLALVTFEDLPNLSEDDRLLKADLERGFASVETPLWSDPSIEWSGYDAVIMRSIWDFHKKPRSFLAWLDDLEAEDARVFNPVEAVRWNFSKRYLLELETEGVPVVTSHLVKMGDRIKLADIMKSNGWREAVVRPVISASAMRTKRVPLEGVEFFQPVFESWLEDGELLVQPFLHEIQTAGEYSLLYFGSQYSHCVLKKPKAGDFRVQQEYGGLTEKVEPPPVVRQLAQDLNHWLFEKFRVPLLFTRFDLVTVNGKPAVGEIELIEPFLFFGSHAQSTGLFKHSLEKALKSV